MNQTFSFSLGGECTDNITGPEPEAPVLDEGMIPVTIANDGTVTTISETDSGWYDYSEKQWANVVLVDDTNRQTYLDSLSDNVTVAEDNILAYYVWIPRYKYKIPNRTLCSSISGITEESNPECYGLPYLMAEEDRNLLINWILEESGETEEMVNIKIDNMLVNNSNIHFDNINGNQYSYWKIENLLSEYNSVNDTDITYNKTFYTNSYTNNSATTIDIEFEAKTSAREIGDAVNTYYSHPAFWWDDNNNGVTDPNEMLAGIWVGKFETQEGCAELMYNDVYYGTKCEITKITPNVVNFSMGYNIDDEFNNAKKISASGNVYGLSNSSTNSHMSKNSEWGAVAYLSHSVYGKNTNVTSNNCTFVPWQESGYFNSNIYISAPENYQHVSLTGCTSSSNSDNYTSHYGNYDDYPQSTTGNISGIFDMEGGLDEFVMANYNGNAMSSDLYCYDPNYYGDEPTILFSNGMPEGKYYNKYTTNTAYNGCNGEICFGHALSETVDWYDSKVKFISSIRPWLARNGMFSSYSTYGYGDIYPTTPELTFTFRSVLINGFSN